MKFSDIFTIKYFCFNGSFYTYIYMYIKILVLFAHTQTQIWEVFSCFLAALQVLFPCWQLFKAANRVQSVSVLLNVLNLEIAHF